MYEHLETILIIIIICAIVLFAIPLILDYMLEITTRQNRKNIIKSMALQKSQEKNKPLIIFNKNKGIIYPRFDKQTDKQTDKIENFGADLIDTIHQIADNSCVLVVNGSLEYIDKTQIQDLLNKMIDVSGGDLYLTNIESSSPRVFCDPRVKNIMSKSFYLPSTLDSISWSELSAQQSKIQSIYFTLQKLCSKII